MAQKKKAAKRPKKKRAVQSAPAKQITTFRMPVQLMKQLSAKADSVFLSRNKLMEIVLRDYLSKPDQELKALVAAGGSEAVDERSDLFK